MRTDVQPAVRLSFWAQFLINHKSVWNICRKSEDVAVPSLVLIEKKKMGRDRFNNLQ